MGGNLLYADRSCIERVNVFQGWNKCISFRVNPINPAWKQHAMCGTSTISTLNKEFVARGKTGLVGGTSLSCMGRSSDAIVSPGAVGDVPVSWSSSLGSCVWLSTSCLPCNMGLVLNDASPPIELAGSKLCSRSLGGSMCGSFTLCAA
jgi:hypothetical protein